MSDILGLLSSLLNLPVENPLAFIPLFVLEEFGLPLPLVLSGLFTYIGYLVSQGQVSALLLVGVNLIGALVGSTVIYWCARAGLSIPLWRYGNRLTLGKASLTEIMSRLGSTSSFIVLWFRLSPLPLVITSACSGLLRISYRVFVLGVAISALLWNVIYMAGGFIAGEASQRFFGESSGPLRYLPVLAVWLAGAVIFAVLRWRRKSKEKKKETEAIAKKM